MEQVKKRRRCIENPRVRAIKQRSVDKKKKGMRQLLFIRQRVTNCLFQSRRRRASLQRIRGKNCRTFSWRKCLKDQSIGQNKFCMRSNRKSKESSTRKSCLEYATHSKYTICSMLYVLSLPLTKLRTTERAQER